MILAHKLSQRLFIPRLNHLNNTRYGALHSNPMLYHSAENSSADQELLPSEWYENAYRKIQKLSCSLKNVDLIDGRLVNVVDDSTIFDERIEQRMRAFKSLVRVFVGSPSARRRVTETMMAESSTTNCQPPWCFGNSSEREPMVVDSLTKISNFLNVSAQQRKLVRHTICPQVTQHHIWTGALDHMLKELKLELDPLAHQSTNNKGIKMGQQIVSSCLKFLDDATNSNAHFTSWMRPAPSQPVVDPSASPRWEDMLEMFDDLIGSLKGEKPLLRHVAKLEVMKEGLSQIKDVLSDHKSIGHKESKHQESLVQRKLSKTLGHSSSLLPNKIKGVVYVCASNGVVSERFIILPS
ncbi:uncharacterized protein LOC111010055 isoform X2 [Momordica charantia]|uniref:Uncharacterized protein LOC111010055 isoform X2 n=1 Tax=Momordica charantia TaxID=3673 RepID=A0A6J1CB88_MOMCH|nr:uncharacterized protein LOC111010055 isoform X2 [Momordica charantia]